MRVSQATKAVPARRIVFMEEVEDRKQIVMLEKGERRHITSGDDWHLYPDITEQGDQVALVSGPDAKHLGVSVLDLVTGKEHFLTTTDGRNLHPTFSGDGSKIAFSEATGQENRHITVINSPMQAGFEPPSEPKRRVVPGSEGGYFPTLSQDGDLVVYQRAGEGSREIVSYDFDTQSERVVAEGMSPSLSADDSSIAYTKKVDGEWNIHVTELSTGKSRQITHTPYMDFAPSFAPDGSIYFASNRAGSFDIYHLDRDKVESGEGAAPTVIAQGPETFYAPEASA